MKSAGVCHSDGYSHYHALLVSVSILIFCGLLCFYFTDSLKTSSLSQMKQSWGLALVVRHRLRDNKNKGR